MTTTQIVPKTVGILIFPQVEVLDFTGPFEVFSTTRLESGLQARRSNESAPFDVFTVAKTKDPIDAIGGLTVIPKYDFNSAPKMNLLVIPGGQGSRSLLNDSETLEWIKTRHEESELTLSVCTGALLLAKVGLLTNLSATTHWGALDHLASIDPTIAIQRDQRVVVANTDATIYTSAGISAGIDMAFNVVEALHGKEVADETARCMEYQRRT